MLFDSATLAETVTDEEGLRERQVSRPATITSLCDELDTLLPEVSALAVLFPALREGTRLALRRLAGEIEKSNPSEDFGIPRS
jgi:hypothetical protein